MFSPRQLSLLRRGVAASQISETRIVTRWSWRLAFPKTMVSGVTVLVIVVSLGFYPFPVANALLTRIEKVDAPREVTVPLSGPVEVDVTVYYQDATSYWRVIAGVTVDREKPYAGTVTTSIGPCYEHAGTLCAVNVPLAATSQGTITFMFQVTCQLPPLPKDPYGVPQPYTWYLWIFSGLSDQGYNTIHGTVDWRAFPIEVHGAPSTAQAATSTGQQIQTTTTAAQPSRTTTTASQPIPTTTTPTSTPVTAWRLETFEIYVGWAVAAVLAIALVGYVAYHQGIRHGRRR